MASKVLKSLIFILGIVLLVVMLILFARDISRIFNWKDSGFVFSSIGPIDDEQSFFINVNPSDFISSNIPSNGDTLVTIADSSASLQRWIDVLELPHAPGREAIIEYLQNGVLHTTLIKTRPVDFWNIAAVLLLMALRLMIFFAFIILAFWAFIRRSDSPGVRILALYCFSMASYTGLTYLPMFAQVASFAIPFEGLFRGFLVMLSFFFSSFWLLLNFVFPRKSGFFEKHPKWVYALCFLPQILLFSIASILEQPGNWVQVTAWFIMLFQVIAGLLILRYKHIHTDIQLEKRQTKLVFWGSGASILIFMLYILDFFSMVQVFREMPLFLRMTVNNLLFLILLASPISFAYALRKYRLLEFETNLRRGTVYLITSGIVLVLLIALVYLVGIILLESIGISSRTPTLLIALSLALGFAPAHRRLKSHLELKFYPERQKLKDITKEFLQQAATIPDCESLCCGMEEMLVETLGVQDVNLGIKRGSGEHFTLPNGTIIPISADGDWLNYLNTRGFPLVIDEAIASSKVIFSKEEVKWLQEHEIALVLPLRTHASLLGFIALGKKSNSDDFDAEELVTLKILSDQFSLALENQNLLEGNLEKRRMEAELQIARKVQMRFLPQQLPETCGLEIKPVSSFCLEVAGDYYDIIPKNDGSTVIAVGDVSGKGTGAALIMANLQASLRAFIGVGLNMDDLVTRINDLIYKNTDSEQYITFFVSVFHPLEKTLTYVNAGHNYPLIIRNKEVVDTLQAGGVILGAFPSMPYHQATIKLQTGDLLLIYTDGFSEAMNDEEEEFGEERLKQFILTNSDLPVDEISQNLISEVNQFRQGNPVSDDMTLILTRVL